MAKLQYKRFPGDVIVVPNVIGVLLNSFVPGFLNIGSFWTAWYTEPVLCSVS